MALVITGLICLAVGFVAGYLFLVWLQSQGGDLP